DVALAYALVVLVLSVLVAAQPPEMLRDLVQQSSTNLANLRERPLFVLVLSAFLISPAWQLVLLVPVVVVYGAIQIWLGRFSTVVIGALGHVGATLFVMAAEITALYRHIARFNIVVKLDVGVSYGLAAALGLLVARVPHRWRLAYGLVSLAVIVLQAVLLRNFTSLGHTIAWLIGLSVAWLVHRARRSAQLAGRT
ncbi:MAG: rhomboid-like protein, partial [Propionibacteriaceae bacterium]